ncbi:unnamed protein product [Brassica oleracea var. botrytis]|uniref:Uncharacterized protein n=1 Tax=Brassica oleracea TaxID=3712 RepID=A0A3P6H282_BRAOL|nr:unnamed protein product [Brassica oleracea]
MENRYKAFTTIPRLFAIVGLVSQEFTKIKEEMTLSVHHPLKMHERLRDKIFFYQSILSKHGLSSHLISPMGIHPDCLFSHLYMIENAYMPEEVFCFLWYLCSIYTIGITFDIKWLYQYINAQQGQKDCFSTFLTWFAPLSICIRKLRKSAIATCLPFRKLKGHGSLNPFFNPHKIYFFHRHVQVNNKTGKIHALPTLIQHNDYQRGCQANIPYSFSPKLDLLSNRLSDEPRRRSSVFHGKKTQPPVVPKVSKIVKQETQSQECLPKYFKDSQLPDDSMNIA